MATETEIKVYLPELMTIQQRLTQAGATLHKARLFEQNIRYDDSQGNLTQNKTVLRLRQDDRARVTYKEASAQVGGASSRLELETEVADFEVMDSIFRRLGYVTSLVYEKFRTTYTLGEAEIVLDEMPFGNFMEIEGSPEVITDTLRSLGMEHTPRILGSYVDLFEQVKTALHLNFRDITFENFKGLDVPGEVFK